MSDPNKKISEQTDELNFCICGNLIGIDENNCGKANCSQQINDIQIKLEQYFNIEDEIEAFQYFEKLHPGIQGAILIELEDKQLLEYLQLLSEDQVVSILQIPSDELRLRFLEMLEPRIQEQIKIHFSKLDKTDKDGLLDFFLSLIGMILYSLEMKR